MTITFTVYGTPAPQGSKTAGVTKDGKPYLRESSSNALKPWRKAIAAAAGADLDRDGMLLPLDGPLSVQITFTVSMPATAVREHRRWPAVAPDLDKYIRAVLDAIGPKGGRLIADDARVCSIMARKVYPGQHKRALDRPGATITIGPLDDRTEQEALPL